MSTQASHHDAPNVSSLDIKLDPVARLFRLRLINEQNYSLALASDVRRLEAENGALREQLAAALGRADVSKEA